MTTVSTRDVGFDELETGLADGSIVLVDVREPNETATGIIPGSHLMPLSAFAPDDLPASGRIVFSCAAGVRSRRAVELARQAGLETDSHFPPGFKGWAASGRPVEPPPS